MHSQKPPLSCTKSQEQDVNFFLCTIYLFHVEKNKHKQRQGVSHNLHVYIDTMTVVHKINNLKKQLICIWIIKYLTNTV